MQFEFDFVKEVERKIKDENKKLDIILHPTSSQDTSCPNIEFMPLEQEFFLDVGEWKCRVREESCGKYSQNLHYAECCCADHQKCKFYLAANSKK